MWNYWMSVSTCVKRPNVSWLILLSQVRTNSVQKTTKQNGGVFLDVERGCALLCLKEEKRHVTQREDGQPGRKNPGVCDGKAWQALTPCCLEGLSGSAGQKGRGCPPPPTVSNLLMSATISLPGPRPHLQKDKWLKKKSHPSRCSTHCWSGGSLVIRLESMRNLRRLEVRPTVWECLYPWLLIWSVWAPLADKQLEDE